MTHKSMTFPLALTCLCLPFLLPEVALASGGITELVTPLQKVVDTITGPAGKLIAVMAMCITGLIYTFNKQELSDGFKMLLNVVFGIGFISFSTAIVNQIFGFSGALVAVL